MQLATWSQLATAPTSSPLEPPQAAYKSQERATIPVAAEGEALVMHRQESELDQKTFEDSEAHKPLLQMALTERSEAPSQSQSEGSSSSSSTDLEAEEIPVPTEDAPEAFDGPRGDAAAPMRAEGQKRGTSPGRTDLLPSFGAKGERPSLCSVEAEGAGESTSSGRAALLASFEAEGATQERSTPGREAVLPNCVPGGPDRAEVQERSSILPFEEEEDWDVAESESEDSRSTRIVAPEATEANSKKAPRASREEMRARLTQALREAARQGAAAAVASAPRRGASWVSRLPPEKQERLCAAKRRRRESLLPATLCPSKIAPGLVMGDLADPVEDFFSFREGQATAFPG